MTQNIPNQPMMRKSADQIRQEELEYLVAHNRELNDLLELYFLLQEILHEYFADPQRPSRALEIFYIRELTPTIRKLVGILHMDPEGASPFRIPANKTICYIPFSSLFSASAYMKENSISKESVFRYVNQVWASIKDAAEKVRVVSPTAGSVSKIVKKMLGHGEAILRGENITDKVLQLTIFPHKGWWHVSVGVKKKGAKPILKQGYWAGELLGYLGVPWGVPRSMDSVFDALQNKTGERPGNEQIDNAMREINRKLNANKLPRIALTQTTRQWKFEIIETHE